MFFTQFIYECFNQITLGGKLVSKCCHAHRAYSYRLHIGQYASSVDSETLLIVRYDQPTVNHLTFNSYYAIHNTIGLIV